MKKQLFLLLFAYSTVYGQDISSILKAKPFGIHASLSAGYNGYSNISKDTSLSSPIGSNSVYYVQFNPVINIYSFSLPFNFMLSSQGNTANASLPFNRFSVSPGYKWITLHLGWQSLQFSQFTLAGQQMNGAGIELNPGKLRLGFMYGTFNEAVTDISQFNNLNSNATLYKRKGYAAKLGYGSSGSYIQFTFLKAKDDSTSISKALLDTASLRPAANEAVSVESQLTFFKHLALKVEAATSFYTSDITSDTIGSTGGILDKLKFLKPINTSSKISIAGEASMNYLFKTGNVHVKFRYVDPNYQSMGAFYMQTDIEQTTAGFAFSAFKGKFHISTDIGVEQNNLGNITVSNTQKNIANVNVSVNPSSVFGLDIGYSNFGISQQIIPQLNNPGTLLKYDSVRISQVNQSISISPHLFFNGKNIKQTINLQTSIQTLNNANSSDTTQNFNSTMATFVYALLFSHSNISISNTLNYFNTVAGSTTTATKGYNLSISKSFVTGNDKKSPSKAIITGFSIGLMGGYFSNLLNNTTTGKSITASVPLTVTFFHKHSFMFNTGYLSNQNNSGGNQNQLMYSIRYNTSF